MNNQDDGPRVLGRTKKEWQELIKTCESKIRELETRHQELLMSGQGLEAKKAQEAINIRKGTLAAAHDALTNPVFNS